MVFINPSEDNNNQNGMPSAKPITIDEPNTTVPPVEESTSMNNIPPMTNDMPLAPNLNDNKDNMLVAPVIEKEERDIFGIKIKDENPTTPVVESTPETTPVETNPSPLSTPSEQAVNVTPSASGKYKLTLHRQKNFVGCLVGFIIYIDDVKVGKIKNGKTLELEVEGGQHTISVHKNNPVNIYIDRDTTADVVVYGANNFGITNINGAGATNEENTDHYLDKTKKNTNYTLYSSIALPVISTIILFAFGYYIQFWVFGIVAGYALVNMFGLKNLKGKPEYKSLLTKNIIAFVISLVAAIVMAYVVNFMY